MYKTSHYDRFINKELSYHIPRFCNKHASKYKLVQKYHNHEVLTIHSKTRNITDD